MGEREAGFFILDQLAHAHHRGNVAQDAKVISHSSALFQRGEGDDAAQARQIFHLLHQPRDFRKSLGVVAVGLHGDEVADRTGGRPQ
jgi:hypothetical protein